MTRKRSRKLEYNRHPEVGPLERCLKVLSKQTGPMLMRDLREQADVKPTAMTRIKPRLRALGYAIEERSRRHGHVIHQPNEKEEAA